MADPFVTPQAAEILRAARERIATPERWTQGAFSNTGTGSANPGAWRPDTCLCVNGALLAVAWAMPAETTGTLLRSGASLCLSLAARARGFETASRFNDHPSTTHADALALFDEAAALAESLAEPQS